MANAFVDFKKDLAPIFRILVATLLKKEPIMEHLKQIWWLYAEKFLKDSSRSMIFQFARDKRATNLDQWIEFQQNQLSQSLSADLSVNINILARKVAILPIRCRLQHILEQP